MINYKDRDELLIRLNLTRDPDETLDFSQELEEMYKEVPLEVMCRDFVETDDVYLNRMLRLNIIKQLMISEENIEEPMLVAVYRKILTLQHLKGNPRAYGFAIKRLTEMNYELENNVR